MLAGEPEATDADVLAALGLTLDAPEVSDHPRRTADASRLKQAELDEISSIPEPHGDPDMIPRDAWGGAEVSQREAVLQPAMPMVRRSERLRMADFEAG